MRALSALLLAAALAQPARADIQFSNGPAVTDETVDGTRFTSPNGNIRSLGFTIPADGPSYRLDEVEITLNYGQNFAARVEVWQGAGAPSSLVAPLVTLLPPAGQWGYPYSPTDRVELLPGVTYWIRVSAAVPNSDFFWNAKNPGSAPDGVFDFVGYHNSSGPPRFTRNTAIIRARPILLDNLSIAPGAGTTLLGQPSPMRKAAGFTPPPGQDWLLRSITFSLSGTGAQPEVRLFNGLSASEQRDFRQGGAFSGTLDYSLRYTESMLRLRALERWWIELRTANAQSLTWRGTAPNTQPTGLAFSNGFLLNGHPNSIANRYEVLATPLLGMTPSLTDGSVFVHEDEFFATELILPPRRTATVQGVGVRFSNPTPGHFVNLEIWTGAAGPETLLMSLEERNGIDTLHTAIYALPTPLDLVPGQRYWIRIVEHVTSSPLQAYDGRAQMEGILRLGPSLEDGEPVDTPLLFIVGFGSNPCPADLSGSTDPLDFGYDVPDGLVDSADFFYYLDQFDHGNQPVADLTATSDPSDPLYGFPDGAVNADDFFYYLDIFTAGCP